VYKIRVGAPITGTNLSQAVTLQATVTPSNATGKVTFYDGTEILGVAPVANGVANFTTISTASARLPRATVATATIQAAFRRHASNAS